MDISTLITEALSETGLSQRKLADKIGVPLRTLEDWKSGRRHPNDFTVNAVFLKLEELKGEN